MKNASAKPAVVINSSTLIGYALLSFAIPIFQGSAEVWANRLPLMVATFILAQSSQKCEHLFFFVPQIFSIKIVVEPATV